MMASDRDQLLERARQAERDASLPNPISLFDHHLRVLDQSYIQFFQDRIRIEEQYIASLSLLYQKTRYVDSQLDNGVETTSLRSAWREARDCIDREAETRGAFVSALRNDVVNPLVALKESNERTRKRIKEDIKDSYQAHIDYQDNVLPRLKQKYMKKVQDVEDYKGMDRPALQNSGFAPIPQSIAQPAAMATSPPTTTVTFPSPPNGALNAAQGSPPRPPLPSPQPQTPATANALIQQQQQPARPSTQPPVQRNRSPSASTSLSDLAHQSKKALRGFLQDGGNRNLGSMRDNFGDRGNISLKGVKAKRDADEADKEYRKGVHWLETLRLRRATIIRSGYTSLEDFIWEQGLMLKKVLQKYVDDMLGTAHTSSQLAGHIQGNINKISLENDRDMQTQTFTHVDLALKRALPPTLYHNFLMGDSKDLIFGTGLVNYATARGMTGEPGVALGLARGGKLAGKDGGVPDKMKPDGIGQAQETVPRLVQLCVADIDARGLTTEGIYRVSGRFANVQELRHLVEKDEATFDINPHTDDVFCVSSLLKQYLRELPEPVFRFPLAERLQYTEDRDEHIAHKFTVLRNKMRRLPPVHQATLRLVVEHLARIASNCSQNKMDAKNLSIVFGTLLFGEDEIPKGVDVLTLTQGKDSVLEDLITYAPMLFDDKGQSSPPLPLAPLEEPVTIDYGSSHTKVYAPGQPRKPNQDFSPTMPSKPDFSIHPATRRVQGGSSASSAPREEMLPATKELPLGLDLGSPSTEIPPPPPPASEKKRFEGMDRRSEGGHGYPGDGTSPRKSFYSLRRDGSSTPPRKSMEAKPDEAA